MTLGAALYPDAELHQGRAQACDHAPLLTTPLLTELRKHALSCRRALLILALFGLHGRMQIRVLINGAASLSDADMCFVTMHSLQRPKQQHIARIGYRVNYSQAVTRTVSRSDSPELTSQHIQPSEKRRTMIRAIDGPFVGGIKRLS